MAKITINTRDIGSVTFFCQDKGGYVFANLNGQPGTLGRQICEGGSTMGNTLSANEKNLAEVARRWNKQRRAKTSSF